MNISLKQNQKVFFASDFHLGAPNQKESLKREKLIVRWLDNISNEAAAVFLVGDIFDFWFEYDKVVPKGFMRFLAKITEMRERNIPVFFFTGNHDLWMKNYFTEELDIPVYSNPLEMEINHKRFLVGHGDGLGPGDKKYKILKKLFTNSCCQWLFKWIHPDLGIRLAQNWSKSSRISNLKKNEDEFKGEDKEWLYLYCKDIESKMHFDYYVFGHRHLPLELQINRDSTYYNLGEWVSQFRYGEFDGASFSLKKFEA